jgi:LacI family fructose operon transcriptional repressor
MDPKPITINDVAREAGVSIATVSRVLSGGSASAAAREKVMAAARALGYHKTTVERRSDAGEERALALVISDLTNPYYSLLCAGAEQAARLAGWSLIVCQPDFSPGAEQISLSRVAALPVHGQGIDDHKIEVHQLF